MDKNKMMNLFVKLIMNVIKIMLHDRNSRVNGKDITPTYSAFIPAATVRNPPFLFEEEKPFIIICLQSESVTWHPLACQSISLSPSFFRQVFVLLGTRLFGVISLYLFWCFYDDNCLVFCVIYFLV
jgi:hypothetical protein